MRLLFLSFYFRPDLSAGSFRATALAEALDDALAPSGALHIITTQPNRYKSFREAAPFEERTGRTTIVRLPVGSHSGGLADQGVAFASFSLRALWRALWAPSDAVFATSSRLFTAFLGAVLARLKRLPLYLDIRDIFVESIEPLLPARARPFVMPVLRGMERFTIHSARKVNLVSEGFRDYFETRYPGVEFGYIPNGVDREFLEGSAACVPASGRKTILYAGNIGEGQGLHRIVPDLARALAAEFDIVVVGDGGRREALERAVAGLPNVRILPPVRRAELRALYDAATVLFLHLNDMPAFRRVLPSKVFEYAATGKPILAGLAGYPARFVAEQIGNAQVFAPCDGAEGVRALQRLTLRPTDRREFVERFSRERLSVALSHDIVATLAAR